jgi:hypothetical protein
MSAVFLNRIQIKDILVLHEIKNPRLWRGSKCLYRVRDSNPYHHRERVVS